MHLRAHEKEGKQHICTLSKETNSSLEAPKGRERTGKEQSNAQQQQQASHMAVEYEAATLDRYLDDDLALINNRDLWKEYKRGALHNEDVCYIYKPTGDSIWWIKLVAYVENGSMANIDNLLDASLKQRHPEWHELYIDGRIIRKNDDGRSEICYFQ
jgi:hypothetical protein